MKSIINFLRNKIKPQNPDYLGQYGNIFRALDYNRDAGRLVKAI